MQTIIVILNPGKLKNPDIDLCYSIPERIEEVSNGLIQENGYDFLDTKEEKSGPLMGIWLKTKSAKENWSIITKLFKEEKLKENDLSISAKIYISENDTEDIENCTLVFPNNVALSGS